MPAANAQTFQLHGFLTAREIDVRAQPSWDEAGVGRFDVGASSPADSRKVNVDVAQLGVDWTPLTFLNLHADGIARHEPSGVVGKRAGLVQAYAEAFNDHFRVRAGLFWLPTSRENVDPLWTSPYTLTYSAMNTWIGEEVRPIGIDVQYSPNFYVTAGATAFRGNDTMGTVLAARGWAFGSRLSTYDESIATYDGPTRPIGKDLDSKNGYSGRLRFQLPERAMFQATRIDNRATLTAGPVDNQTPWRTKFNVLSGTIGTTSASTLAAEWMYGSTAVGFPGGSFEMRFDTAYVLASTKRGGDRWTARIERFSTHSAGNPADDEAREHGHAITVAWLHDIGPHLRAGVEWMHVTGGRPGLVADGFDPRTGGRTITVELRYGF